MKTETQITDKIQLVHGNSLVELKAFAENSVDSIVTDPPYEYGFMGKSWDSTGIAYNVELWKECLRVLKPGGHIMAFGSSRTHHRLMVAIEDAGFEIRDTVCWIFGSGFPKSLNIGKAVDKLQGNEREDLGDKIRLGDKKAYPINSSGEETSYAFGNKDGVYKNQGKVTKGTSEYEGWGTALKPAVEYICMARKPLSEKTVAENCLKWGTGGINIDESRVDFVSEADKKESTTKNQHADFGTKPMTNNNVYGDYSMIEPMNFNPTGRFPANLIHDNSEEVRECFPETGNSARPNVINTKYKLKTNTIKLGLKPTNHISLHNDSGNASRFFKSIIYQAKPSKAERNRGCETVFNLFEQSEGLEEKQVFGDNGSTYKGLSNSKIPSSNNHPTVKPIALMEYLIKMVTPKGGVVLDPFNGSGSTGCAAAKNGFGYIGIDMTEEYIKISEKRIKAYLF